MRMPARARTSLLVHSALLLALALLWSAGCERSRSPEPQQPAAPTPAASAGSFVQPAPGGDADAPAIVMLGDSITAGYGLPPEQAYPTLIAERLRAEGSHWRIVNAGVSGDTTAGGLSRLDWLLRQRVDILLVALGGNDGLRGLEPDAMRANLAHIIERAQARGITVVLAGMRMPANYGADYQRRFAEVFPALARQYKLAFVPFLLEGVAMRADLNQPDGIHPNERGAQIVADTVWRVLKPLLDKG
jgi:acyl-CoA thioesterase-1